VLSEKSTALQFTAHATVHNQRPNHRVRKMIAHFNLNLFNLFNLFFIAFFQLSSFLFSLPFLFLFLLSSFSFLPLFPFLWSSIPPLISSPSFGLHCAPLEMADLDTILLTLLPSDTAAVANAPLIHEVLTSRGLCLSLTAPLERWCTRINALLHAKSLQVRFIAVRLISCTLACSVGSVASYGSHRLGLDSPVFTHLASWSAGLVQLMTVSLPIHFYSIDLSSFFLSFALFHSLS
jgi:hypothetical protein